jgi:hypothetical protein
LSRLAPIRCIAIAANVTAITPKKVSSTAQ